MTKAAIYARFSSSRQREESIADQVRVCTERIAREGWDVGPVYTDEARSGTDASGRPGFQQMVADAGRGRFDVLVVYKLDRFARNRYDSATYRAKLRRSGVEVVSATEGVPDGPEGIILGSVLEGMAEYYSANLAQNVMRGMEGNALKCGHNGVRVFGYENGDDGLYRVDPAEAPGVLMAFRMAAEGARKVDIMAALNSSGYRTVRGRKWSQEAVAQMLRQEKYLGTYSWGKVRVEGGMPAIVDRRLWDDAHANVASAGRKERTREVESYVLTGKLYDAEGNRFESNCGRGSNGRYYYYYRCRATGATVRRDEVEGRVRRALASLLDSEPELEDRIVRMVLDEQDAALADDLAAMDALRSRLSAIDREADNLVDLAARLGATDRIAEKLRALEEERGSVAADLDEMEAGTPVVDEDMVRYVVYRMRTCEDESVALAAFVDRVEIGPDGQCLVTFNLLKQEKTQTPEGVWEISLGSPYLRVPKLIPYPGGFAIAA